MSCLDAHDSLVRHKDRGSPFRRIASPSQPDHRPQPSVPSPATAASLTLRQPSPQLSTWTSAGCSRMHTVNTCAQPLVRDRRRRGAALGSSDPYTAARGSRHPIPLRHGRRTARGLLRGARRAAARPVASGAGSWHPLLGLDAGGTPPGAAFPAFPSVNCARTLRPCSEWAWRTNPRREGSLLRPPGEGTG